MINKMKPEEIVKVTELVQVLRDEVAQLKKFLNPIEHCNGITTKGAPCRNRCVSGTNFCKKHTVALKKPVPEPEIENTDSEIEKKLKKSYCVVRCWSQWPSEGWVIKTVLHKKCSGFFVTYFGIVRGICIVHVVIFIKKYI